MTLKQHNELIERLWLDLGGLMEEVSGVNERLSAKQLEIAGTVQQRARELAMYRVVVSAPPEMIQ